MNDNDATEDLRVSRESVSNDDEAKVLALVKKFMQELESGAAPSVDAFLKQYPDLANELRPALEGLAIAERLRSSNAGMDERGDSQVAAKPIGDFKIVGELGRGGMGVVYEAIQLSLGRRVALKVLPFASGLDEIRLQRFKNEAHAAAALHHTHIVPVYAVGSDRGVHYYAMQLIDGKTLAEYIEQLRQSNRVSSQTDAQESLRQATNGRVPTSKSRSNLSSNPERPALSLKPSNDTVAIVSGSTNWSKSATDRQRFFQTVVAMVVQASQAIEYAHRYGVIHRDIKPANLMLDRNGKIWVTDFGLAQVQAGDSQLTQTGDRIGTLRYMSPEQAEGNRVMLDHRTDLYSLGATLFELLTLKPALQGEGYRQMFQNLMEQEVPSLRSIDALIPVDLDTIVRKAMAKSPSDRYATAQAFADDLQRWLDDKPIAAKPPTVVDRFVKWRRRNSGLVAAVGLMFGLAAAGLAITTWMIWSEQFQTRLALDRETQQRALAEQSFAQAKLAVDTFSTLSETELAYRPDLQDLRRNFLEASLSFYRDFLAQRSGDSEYSSELEATSERVAGMVEELKVLDNVLPLMLIYDTRVQNEINLEADVANELIDAFAEFASSEVGSGPGGLASFSSLAMNGETKGLRSLEEMAASKLTMSQIERLKQISRQERLPFTFKSSEVVEALDLTLAQRESINRIIIEHAPLPGRDGMGPRRNNMRHDRDGPPPDGRPGGPDFLGPPGRFGGPNSGKGGPVRRDDFGPPSAFGRPGDFGPPRGFGPPDDFGPPGEHGSPGLFGPIGGFPPRPGEPPRPDRGGFGPPGRVFEDQARRTAETIAAILEILTSDQREKWGELIGKPIAWQF